MSKQPRLKGFFPGSFNPFHAGHYSVLTKSLRLFDKVYVVISQNTNKPESAPMLERFQQVKAYLTQEPIPTHRYEVIMNDSDLTVRIAQKHDVLFLIRGIRNNHDLKKELELEKVNKLLAPEIQTVYLTSDFRHVKTSSTLLRELKMINKSTYLKITSKESLKNDD